MALDSLPFFLPKQESHLADYDVGGQHFGMRDAPDRVHVYTVPAPALIISHKDLLDTLGDQRWTNPWDNSTDRIATARSGSEREAFDVQRDTDR